MNAYGKDILRTFKKEKKRFLSILVITFLGVMTLSGLKAGCEDLRYSADSFYDAQNLFDISVMSTLGMSKDDITAIKKLKNVETVEGSYSESRIVYANEEKENVEIKLLCENFNTPYIVDGRLPESEKEIIVSQKYLNDTSSTIGDTITFEEDSDSNLKHNTYKIVGTFLDASDVNNKEGAISFRSTTTYDDTFYVSEKEAIDTIYSVVYVQVKGTKDVLTYSDEYQDKIDKVKEEINAIADERKALRYEEVKQEALDSWQEGYDTYLENKQTFDDEISEAKQKLSDAKEQLDEGQETLDEQKETFNTKISKAKKQLSSNEKKLKAAKTQLETGKKQLEETKKQYETLVSTIATLQATKTQLETSINSGMLDDATLQYMQAQLDSVTTNLETCESNEALMKSGIESAEKEISSSESLLSSNEKKLDAAKKKLEKQESAALEKFEDAQEEIDEGYKEYNDGVQELNENVSTNQDKLDEAYKKLMKAKKKIEDMDHPTWYVNDRNSLSSYVNIDSDSSSIESIGTMFPFLFLSVAILIALTSITRLVEEERMLIGTYKALGYTPKETRRKYVLFAFFACLLGGILGDVGGFIIFPQILFTVFKVMYLIPTYHMTFNTLYGIGGILLFVVGILIAAYSVIYLEERETPAILMRPKAPKGGSRILLEKVTFIWNKLSFLNKVTARNIFRYKKRLFMSVIGVMGCTALVVCAFAIKDTVSDLMPSQYEQIYRYDIMGVYDDSSVIDDIQEESNIKDYISLEISTLKAGYNGKEETVTLYVVDNPEDLKNYVHLEDVDGNSVTLKDNDILITENASTVLGFTSGDTINLVNVKNVEKQGKITGIVQNYLGNNIFMSKKTYNSIFNDYEENAFLAHVHNCDEIEYASSLSKWDDILTIRSTKQMKQDFTTAFALINMVVYIILSLAAALAFVVLYTLSTTNISERERELATMKVLGFYNPEVHLYVNKETFLLSVIGIILGLPVGSVLGHTLTSLLKMPSIHFAVTIHPISFIISAILTLVFTLIVNIITNTYINKINMIEALKSIE